MRLRSARSGSAAVLHDCCLALLSLDETSSVVQLAELASITLLSNAIPSTLGSVLLSYKVLWCKHTLSFSWKCSH
jgi:hypothetical protein